MLSCDMLVAGMLKYKLWGLIPIITFVWWKSADSGTQHKENVLHNSSSPVLQNEDTTSGEPQQHNNLAAIRRKALMQRELQQNGINMRAVNGADGNQTDAKVSTPGNKEENFTEELRTNTQAKSLDSTPSPRACQVKVCMSVSLWCCHFFRVFTHDPRNEVDKNMVLFSVLSANAMTLAFVTHPCVLIKAGVVGL